VVISRFRRRQPIYKAGQDHVYHRLTRLGMSSIQSVTTMHVAALFAGCLAFIALTLPPFWANALFALVLLSGAIILLWLDKNSSAEE